MPKNIPSLKPRELVHLLEKGGCLFLREGKGDHSIYIRAFGNQKRVVPAGQKGQVSTINKALKVRVESLISSISGIWWKR